MFSFRKFSPSQIRSFCAGVKSKSYNPTNMPDKLYKTIELEIKSAEPQVIKSYVTFISMAASHLNVPIGKVWSMNKAARERWTLLKSVHIYRKHLVQYEVRNHFTWVLIHKVTGSTADTFLEYIERMLPEGVALKVTKSSVEPLPTFLNAKSVADSSKVNS